MIKAETQQKQLVEIDLKDTIQRISAYGLLVQDDKVLVVKTYSGNWELPGGGCEDGETLTQTVRRELKEETNIDVEVGHMVYVRESFYHSPSGKTYHSVQCFFLVATTDIPTAGDVKEAGFVQLDALNEDNTNTSAYLAIKNMTDTVSYRLWES